LRNPHPNLRGLFETCLPLFFFSLLLSSFSSWASFFFPLCASFFPAWTTANSENSIPWLREREHLDSDKINLNLNFYLPNTTFYTAKKITEHTHLKTRLYTRHFTQRVTQQVPSRLTVGSFVWTKLEY
jgi:hypothetical protein